jgi:hypothetical protein
MSRPSIITLASNPNLISGIYNYCDRWCERCPLTSRCLVYATEQNDNEESGESQDLRNQQFWQELTSTLEETRQMVAEWASQTGIDLNSSEDQSPNPRKRQNVNQHPLTNAGKKYAAAVSDWFRELDQQTINTDNPDSFEDARQVIQWYQYQISVKTMRALAGRREEESEVDLSTELPRDSDGSAKVALLGIDRSIVAWRLMQTSLSEPTESIKPLMLQLERLRIRLETHFPEARRFIRPGFDDVSGVPTDGD